MAHTDRNTQITDIMIHIDETINQNEEKTILGRLEKIESVKSHGFNTPHLIIINYNPKKANSFELLSAVRSQGYHAQLIGL